MIDGKAISEAIVSTLILIVIVTAAATTALIFGLPWLWALLKPLLHSWTA